MDVEVAVMEPKYQINLGYIARVSKNFSIEKLYLINPRCDRNGRDAIKYSKHAKDLLKKARICERMEDLGGGFIVGTTGIWHKTDGSFYNVYDLESVRRLASRAAAAGRKTIVLLGRDDTGLSKEELRECDATVSIETSRDYPILNISHALAIILHGLKRGKARQVYSRLYANDASKTNMFRLFQRLVNDNPRIRDKRSVNMAFRHVVGRSMPTRKEVNALSIALSPSKGKRGRGA